MATHNKNITSVTTFSFTDFERQNNINGFTGLYSYANKYGVPYLYNIYSNYIEIYNWISKNISPSDTDIIGKFTEFVYKNAENEFKSTGQRQSSEKKAEEYWSVWSQQNKISNIAKKAPSPDVESKMASGLSTTTLSEAVITVNNNNSNNSSNNNSNNILNAGTSLVSSAGSLVSNTLTGAVGVAGSVTNLSADVLGSAAVLTGVALELSEYIISETVSYIGTATGQIAAAGVSYTTKLVTDTTKKTASYVTDMVKERAPSLSDFTVPIDIKNEEKAIKLKSAQKAAKLSEATDKINKAKNKISGKLKEVQNKITYITVMAEEGPGKLEELGKDIINTGLSYVGNVRDKVIKNIADWEEDASNKLAYVQAQKQADETIVKMQKQMKKSADNINKMKAKATIVSKKAIAVAKSKVAALIGI